jgi:hypothetical protein
VCITVPCSSVRLLYAAPSHSVGITRGEGHRYHLLVDLEGLETFWCVSPCSALLYAAPSHSVGITRGEGHRYHLLVDLEGLEVEGVLLEPVARVDERKVAHETRRLHSRNHHGINVIDLRSKRWTLKRSLRAGMMRTLLLMMAGMMRSGASVDGYRH